jgi:hypothetical protein
MRCSPAKARAKRRSSLTRAMFCSTIGMGWRPMSASQAATGTAEGGPRVDSVVTFPAAAYNLIRLRTLLARPSTRTRNASHGASRNPVSHARPIGVSPQQIYDPCAPRQPERASSLEFVRGKRGCVICLCISKLGP